MRKEALFSYNPEYTLKGLLLLAILTNVLSINLGIKISKYIYLIILSLFSYLPFRLLKSTFKTSSLFKGTFIFSAMIFYSSETLLKIHIPVPLKGALTTLASIVFLTSGLNTRDNEWVLLFIGGISGYMIPLLTSTLFSNIYYIYDVKNNIFCIFSGIVSFSGFLSAVISNIFETYVSRETFLKYLRLWGR